MNILDELQVTRWSLRVSIKGEESTHDGNLGLDSETEDDELLTKKEIINNSIEKSGVVTLLFDKSSYVKYQAKDVSVCKFVSDVSSYLGSSDINLKIELAPVFSANNILVTLNGNLDSRNGFYNLEQIFLYPVRKKMLFEKLNSLV